MSTDSSRGLLVTILVVCAANLVVAGVQTALMFRQPAASILQADSNALPTKLTENQLAEIAVRVTEPYNRGDMNALYEAFDPMAKTQLSVSDFEKKIGSLAELVGTVDSAAYVGFQRLPKQAGMESIDMYQLNYSVRLVNGPFSSGSMKINIVDRPGKPGIVGFFIYGMSQ